ncbi:zinc finger MYM-type protein 1-like [Aphis craccivora]|uniref:Zinc finger MYM-type protein 1-like n=1 Tax=Aphis craccivora TaxID=307492 RepID=A0A6G0Y3L9_APHCR|nr:zinc finger MYM-type protein 1-like [Aphis craccivora]
MILLTGFLCLLVSLLTIMDTLPVTTVTAERSFSTLRRLKIYLRNNMGETRLTGLALLNIYRNVDLNVEEIIDRFAMLPRKWDFILKYLIIRIFHTQIQMALLNDSLNSKINK